MIISRFVQSRLCYRRKRRASPLPKHWNGIIAFPAPKNLAFQLRKKTNDGFPPTSACEVPRLQRLWPALVEARQVQTLQRQRIHRKERAMITMSPGKKAARTRMLRKRAAKAVATRQHRMAIRSASARKAAKTRKRRAAARKAALTRQINKDFPPGPYRE